jgi:hypothetical protein
MGTHEDYLAVRRASINLTGLEVAADSRIMSATAALLRRAASSDLAFIRLHKAGIQDEVIDLAWAVNGEERPGGPAVKPVEETAAP